jgi:ABC-2 type transport system ATP-binding protein
VIKIDRVTKIFGPTVAVKNISFEVKKGEILGFEVKKGEILGFLGPNGAGKTTTMRIITGYFPPTNGNAYVAGHSVIDDPLSVKRQIGYVPENPSMYKDMRVNEYLRFVGAIKGVKRSLLKESIEKNVQLCALESVVHKRIKELSKGFRQRVALGQALVNDPPVLVLDEPTSGLDPKQIHEIRELIKSMAGKRTIILSTHILPEVSMTCNKVVIINEGKIVAVDTTENIGRSFMHTNQIEVTVQGSSNRIIENLTKMDGINRVDHKGMSYIIDVEKDTDLRAEIAKKIVENGFDLLELKRKSLSLEDIFLKLVIKEEGQIQ